MIAAAFSVVAALVALVTAVVYLRNAHRRLGGVALIARIALGVGLVVLGGGILARVATTSAVNPPALAMLSVLFALVAIDANESRSGHEID